jgi:hypothetical protein
MGSMQSTRRIESTFMLLGREREQIGRFDRGSPVTGSLRAAIVLRADSAGDEEFPARRAQAELAPEFTEDPSRTDPAPGRIMVRDCPAAEAAAGSVMFRFAS